MAYTFYGKLNFRMCTVRYCRCDIDATTVICTCNNGHDCLSPRALAIMFPEKPKESEPEKIVVIAAAAAMFILLVLITALLYKMCQKKR